MMLNPNSALVADFLRWWTRRSEVAAGDLFAPNIRYEQAFPSMSGEAGMRLIEQSPPWENFILESEVHEANTATLEARGVDPVTGLQHRISWRLRFEGGRIVDVSETVQPGAMPRDS